MGAFDKVVDELHLHQAACCANCKLHNRGLEGNCSLVKLKMKPSGAYVCLKTADSMTCDLFTPSTMPRPFLSLVDKMQRGYGWNRRDPVTDKKGFVLFKWFWKHVDPRAIVKSRFGDESPEIEEVNEAAADYDAVAKAYDEYVKETEKLAKQTQAALKEARLKAKQAKDKSAAVIHEIVNRKMDNG